MDDVSSRSDVKVIGDNLRRVRLASGMSQTALADAMRAAGQKHWRQNTVSRIEQGKQELNVGEIEALSHVLSGDILAGTELGASLERTTKVLLDTATVSRLRKAHEALVEAERAIRGLRVIYDHEYSDPEAEENF